MPDFVVQAKLDALVSEAGLQPETNYLLDLYYIRIHLLSCENLVSELQSTHLWQVISCSRCRKQLMITYSILAVPSGLESQVHHSRSAHVTVICCSSIGLLMPAQLRQLVIAICKRAYICKMLLAVQKRGCVMQDPDLFHPLAPGQQNTHAEVR